MEGKISLFMYVISICSLINLPSWLGLEYTNCTNECPGYDTKQSDGEVLMMLGLWGMWSTPILPLLPGPLWPGMVAPDRALSIG